MVLNMERIISAVEKNKQLILDTERYIWKNPETGYKEFKTNKYMAETFAYLDEFNSSGNRIEYGDDNTVKINIK